MQLYKDALKCILHRLPPEGLAAAATTCRFFNRAAKEVLKEQADDKKIHQYILAALADPDTMTRRLAFWRSQQSDQAQKVLSDLVESMELTDYDPFCEIAFFFPFAPKTQAECIAALQEESKQSLEVYFRQAAQFGNVAFYRHLNEHFPEAHPNAQELMVLAAGSNNPAMLMAIKRQFPAVHYDQKVFDAALLSGSIPMVDFIKPKNRRLQFTSDKLIASKSMQLAQHLKNHYRVDVPASALVDAVFPSPSNTF